MNIAANNSWDHVSPTVPSDDCCACQEDESYGLHDGDIPKRLTVSTPQGLIHVTIDYDGGWKTSVSLPPELAVMWDLKAGKLPEIEQSR